MTRTWACPSCPTIVTQPAIANAVGHRCPRKRRNAVTTFRLVNGGQPVN